MTENLHEGHRKRLKERFKNEGAKAFDDHQLLELLLFYCIPRRDTNEIAHRIIKEFGSLSMLFSSRPEDIVEKTNITENAAIFLAIQSEVVRRANSGKWNKRETKISSSNDAGEYAVSLLAYENYENFYVISLDSQKRLINSNLVSEGSVDEAFIYPRIVVECALRNKASSVILAHNHPGGKLKPSFQDLESTSKITKALNMIDIEVLDHIIVADNKYFSFADNGLIKNCIK